MKKLFYSISGLIFICALFISCSKDNGPNVNSAPGKIDAKINSTSFVYNIKNVTKVTNGDSVTIMIYGTLADTSSSLTLSFEKVVKMKPQTFECGLDFLTGTSISAYLATDTGEYFSGFLGGTGEINVLSYNSDAMTGSFDLNPAVMFDSSRTLHIKGDFYAVFDLNSLIKDIDILPGKMQGRINNRLVFFDAIGARVSFNGVDTITNITGTYGSESIVLQFVNLHPLSGDIYTMNLNSYEDNAYIAGSYIQNDSTQFVANGNHKTTGQFTVIKIAEEYMQGKFEFMGKQVDDTSKVANVVDGKFNVRFNSAYHK